MSLRRSALVCLPLLAALAAAACGDDGEVDGTSTATGAGGDGATSGGGSTPTTTTGTGVGGSGAGGGTTCERVLPAADAPRSVVISRPFTGNGSPSVTWERLELSAAGALSRPGTTFEMGRATLGEVAFLPDGAIGAVAQDDGTLGVFSIQDGEVSVLHAAYEGSFYAGHVVPSPDGTHFIVLDTNFPNNGGGLYRVDVDCAGRLTDRGMITASKLAYVGRWLGDDLVLGVREILGAPVDHSVARITWPSPTLVSSADAFGDDEAITAGFWLTRNQAHVLIGDNSAFSAVPNRVAVLSVQGGLAPVQTLADIEDPIALVASPSNDAALVVSGFGDAMFVLDYDPTDATEPFSLRGELDYADGGPQLPGSAVMVERGSQDGLVLVAELEGVRLVRFEGGGVVTDEGLFSLGADSTSIVGAIGVAP